LVIMESFNWSNQFFLTAKDYLQIYRGHCYGRISP
jgi:hypothetical protein